jgi:hypothetical protein
VSLNAHLALAATRLRLAGERTRNPQVRRSIGEVRLLVAAARAAIGSRQERRVEIGRLGHLRDQDAAFQPFALQDSLVHVALEPRPLAAATAPVLAPGLARVGPFRFVHGVDPRGATVPLSHDHTSHARIIGAQAVKFT